MTALCTNVRLGGTTLATEIAPISPPTWETWADGGNGEATFEFGNSAKFAPHLTATDTLMEILVGPLRVWLGRIADYDPRTGNVIGRGIQTDANTIPALDETGSVTRDYGVAIATATSAPWNWMAWNTYPGSSAVLGDSDEPQMMSSLITQLAQQNGYRWGQHPSNAGIYIHPDPTTPTWTIAPEAAAFGSTSEGQATALVGRYFNGSANVTRTRPENLPESPRAEMRDFTDRGVLTEAEVDQILDAELDGLRSRTGWTNGATLHRDQISRNGADVCLAEMHARGMMVRAQGVPVLFSAMQATWLDVVLGKTRYTAGSDLIYLEPVNTAPRGPRDVTAAG